MKEETPVTIEQPRQEEVLRSIRTSRIILPVLLGLGAIAYLLWKRFDPEEFAKIQWTRHTFLWLALALLLLIVRHLAYSTRLYIISNRGFNFKKCIELIFIWEFSTAVAPTTAGGAAVALFVLIQEKLSVAKTVTIVVYKVLLDSIFFIVLLPMLALFFGTGIIRPNMRSVADLDAWGYTFLLVYGLMFAYGALLFYGLFVSPVKIKHMLEGFTRLPFLRRFRERATLLGDEIIIASAETRQHNWRYHLSGFGATVVAWTSRFLLLNCLIVAIIPSTPLDFWNQLILLARVASMYIVTLFSPTPGGAGVTEFVFGGFLSDYIPQTTALVIAFIWRILTYYSYLFAGAVVVPNWVNNLIEYRRLERESGAVADEVTKPE